MSAKLPKRRKHPRMGTREEVRTRCPQHLQWVRGHECIIAKKLFDHPYTISQNGSPLEYRSTPFPHICHGKIQSCHIRAGTDGGTGFKPGDNWVYPGCARAHAEQHEIGEAAFQLKYNVNLKAIAAGLWDRSPARIKYDRKLAATMARTKQIERM